MSRIAGVIAIALAAGCAADDGGDVPLDDDAGVDAGPDAGECHVDCFGGAECEGSTLKLWGFAPRPIACDQSVPPDFCVWTTVPCALGCLADVYVLPGDDQHDPAQYDWLCLPAMPATAGAPCSTDDDCRPTFAIPGNGTVSQTYLACGAGGTCEASAPPVVPGFGASCTAGFDPGLAIQWIDDEATGEACLYASGFDQCVRTFRTRTCAGDWECPEGSRCNTDLHHVDGPPGGVCTPGASVRSSDLPCVANAP